MATEMIKMVFGTKMETRIEVTVSSLKISFTNIRAQYFDYYLLYLAITIHGFLVE